MQIRDRVIVITGASAGVGRATARAFAARGARLGLIAREPEALHKTCAEIEAAGGTAIALPADMADADAVFDAARRCEDLLGPIDIWINNAMATVFSTVEDISPAEFQRVTAVTYLGCVHGTLAALQGMRERNRGVIVQVGSALAYRGIPLQAAYCGAKHAIRGFSDALRTELLHTHSGIHLTAVHLPAINTPQFDWARSHRAMQPRPVAPVYRPEIAAHAILHAARYPKREYWLGGRTPLMILANMLAPGLLDRILARIAFKGQAADRPVLPGREDNLFSPVHGLHRVDGPFEAEARNRSYLFPAPATRMAALLAVGLGAGAIGALIGRSLKRR